MLRWVFDFKSFNQYFLTRAKYPETQICSYELALLIIFQWRSDSSEAACVLVSDLLMWLDGLSAAVVQPNRGKVHVLLHTVCVLKADVALKIQFKNGLKLFNLKIVSFFRYLSFSVHFFTYQKRILVTYWLNGRQCLTTTRSQVRFPDILGSVGVEKGCTRDLQPVCREQGWVSVSFFDTSTLTNDAQSVAPGQMRPSDQFWEGLRLVVDLAHTARDGCFYFKLNNST